MVSEGLSDALNELEDFHRKQRKPRTSNEIILNNKDRVYLFKLFRARCDECKPWPKDSVDMCSVCPYPSLGHRLGLYGQDPFTSEQMEEALNKPKPVWWNQDRKES